ncbi:MAG: phytoene synthase [Actinobacteria bacterium QS_5_72_10]|nr:MAG: phytoene synthase [Actinobacteria bacterium QS_5_72_10]
MVAGAARRAGPLDLDACYDLCRRVHAAHGRTYYLATRLLPPARRAHVHALYGFARYADDLVDHAALAWTPAQRREALEAWSAELVQALEGEARSAPRDPVLRAAAHTITTLGIESGDVRAFLGSMAMDLTVTRYPTFDDLHGYVAGSGAAIGAMMLPVLGCHDPRARPPARSLGIAFQLTNFLRDVAEDWDRGRLYVPLADLEAFGVTEWDFHARHVGPRMRRLLAFQAARRVADRLYRAILCEIADGDYQVFQRRAALSRRRRLALTVGALAGGLRQWPSGAATAPGGCPGAVAGSPSPRRMAEWARKCHHRSHRRSHVPVRRFDPAGHSPV